MEHEQCMRVRGRYRIVALDAGPVGTRGYAVISPAGERIRHEATFEDACRWVDQRIEAQDRLRLGHEVLKRAPGIARSRR